MTVKKITSLCKKVQSGERPATRLATLSADPLTTNVILKAWAQDPKDRPRPDQIEYFLSGFLGTMTPPDEISLVCQMLINIFFLTLHDFI